MNLGQWVSHHARYRAHQPAVVCDGLRLDWAGFDERVRRVSGALAGLGVSPGDRVVTVLGNRVELFEIYFAAARMGWVVVPLSPMLTPAGLRTLLDDSDAVVVVSERAHAAAVDEARHDEACLLVDGEERHGWLDYHARCAAAPADLPPHDSAPDAPYNLIYSSGTTGLPKGIVLTHQTRVMYGALFASFFRMTQKSVALHAGSLVFNGAFLTLMPAAFLGATFVMQSAFDPASFVEAVRRERATHVMLVPSQIVALLASPAFLAESLASLEMICSVGAPLLRTHKEQLSHALPGRLYELYGLTEGFVTVLDRDDLSRKLASVGRPPPLFDLRIERPDGTEAAPDEVGEIVGRGPILMAGYHKRPAATNEAIVGGWLKTGDLGRVDADGYLHLVDRKKDLIISGGINVYPRDIEEVVARHPAVREVAVFGVPDDHFGEAPVAAVRLQGEGVAPGELKGWVNARVGAKFQRVREVIVVDDFPRNTTGKTLKRELREMYLSGGGAAAGSGGFVDTRGLRLHYLRAGRGVPLVLLHGLSANAHFFAGLMRAGIAAGLDVVRLDLRGRGMSDKPRIGYSIEQHAADVLALLDALRLDRVVLAGHSFGALVTLWLAAHHPDRVERQVLLDMAGPTIRSFEVLRLIAPSLDRLDRELPSIDAYLEQMRRMPYLAGVWDEDLEQFYRADVEIRQDGTVRPRSPRRVIDACMFEGAQPDWRRVIGQARAPALVIHAPEPYGPVGTAPIVLREEADELVSQLHDARLVGVPGNHVTMMFGAGAAAVVAAIGAFVSHATRDEAALRG